MYELHLPTAVHVVLIVMTAAEINQIDTHVLILLLEIILYQHNITNYLHKVLRIVRLTCKAGSIPYLLKQY